MSGCRSASSTTRTSWRTSSRPWTRPDPEFKRRVTMIDLFTAPTGNGLRAAVALAESGLPHKLHLAKGEAKNAEYLKLNPAAVIPTIVDPDGPGGKKVLSQSGAILLYIAEKSGKFIPKDAAQKADAMQWFM